MVDICGHDCTVLTMQSFVSRPVSEGHIVLLVAAQDDAAVIGTFADDGSTRDLTRFAADLILLGLGVEVEGSPEPAGGGTCVADVVAHGTWHGWYIHHPTGTIAEIDAPTIARYAALGASQAITAGVAEQLAEDLPDTAAPFASGAATDGDGTEPPVV
jgi:hypothetical protein